MRSHNSLLLVLCIAYGFKLSVSKNAENTVDDEDRIIYQKYIEMDKQLKSLISSGVKSVLPYLMEASEHMNLSSSCMGNILQLTTGIRKLKLSAMKFLDASGKPSAGYLNGNMHLLGDYDQCLNTTVKHRSGLIAFKGKYCLIHYTPLLPKQKRPVTFDGGIEELVEATRNTSELIQFIVSKAQLFYYNPSKLGVCVPSGCSENDIQQVVQYLGEKIYFNAKVAYCDMDDEVFLNAKNTVFICMFVLVGVLVVAGTAVEYFSWKKDINLKSPVIKGVMCFSLLTNFPKAISTKTSMENSIACIHGIRALTLFYIILLHQYYAVVKYFITSHVSKSLDEIPQFFMQIVTNGFLIADVLFFIGGLVNCYSRMKMSDKERRKSNFILQINHKLWRIGPAYLFFCCMESLYRPYGPMRVYEKVEYVDRCDKYWWQNALFINNFFLQDNTCSPHSWYLAADMQLFLLSLFTIPLLLRSPKKGIIMNSVIIFIGIFFTITWSWATNLTPAVVFYRPNRDEINKAWNAHTYTFTHIASYFSGILMGYYLAAKNDIKISKIQQVVGWPVAALLFVSMLFMTKVWNSGGDFSNADSSLYFAFSKFLFALPIGWMILCCITGNGSIINYILCLPFWIPISKISFVVYLVAPFMQTFYFANSRTVVDGHRMPLIWRYFGDTAISCLLGLVIVVLVESPFKQMEKLLFGRWLLKNQESEKEMENISNGKVDIKLTNKIELDLEKSLQKVCK